MKKLSLLVSVLLLTATASIAQKYGHVNFGNLISAIPDTKAADIELEKYQKQLVTKGQNMAVAFQTKVDDYLQKAQTLTPVAAKTIETELEKERQAILSYEQEVQVKLNQKRAELLDPIVKKAQNAVNEVAMERGYIMVFDTSIFNAILYAQESEDIMVFVAAKLGI
jgi:outer membrane protein